MEVDVCATASVLFTSWHARVVYVAKAVHKWRHVMFEQLRFMYRNAGMPRLGPRDTAAYKKAMMASDEAKKTEDSHESA